MRPNVRASWKNRFDFVNLREKLIRISGKSLIDTLDPDPQVVRYLREIQESLHTMDEVINKLQQATTHQTRPYAGGSEILDLE